MLFNARAYNMSYPSFAVLYAAWMTTSTFKGFCYWETLFLSADIATDAGMIFA